MSKEQVKAFFEKVEVDKALQEELKILDEQATDKRTREDSLSKIVNIAKVSGFVFTKEDFINARNEEPMLKTLESNEKDDACWYFWGDGGDSDDDPCGQGTSYVPGGYQPGDEDEKSES